MYTCVGLTIKKIKTKILIGRIQYTSVHLTQPQVSLTQLWVTKGNYGSYAGGIVLATRDGYY